jgi:hypothetical protein
MKGKRGEILIVKQERKRTLGEGFMFRAKESFYGQELLAALPTPTLEDHPLSAVRGCLFNIFAAALHTGGRSSIRNLRTRRAVATGTDLSQT